MLYVSISDETSKVKGKRKYEIMGENVGMISNGAGQRPHHTNGQCVLIGGAQPYPWLVGPCGSAIKIGWGPGHSIRGSTCRTPHPIHPSDLGFSARPREAPPPPHSPPSPPHSHSPHRRRTHHHVRLLELDTARRRRYSLISLSVSLSLTPERQNPKVLP